MGVTSVYLVWGIWGTLAAGLWSVVSGIYLWYGDALDPTKGLLVGGNFGQFGVQLLGVVSVSGFTVLVSSILLQVIKATLGIRVSKEEELEFISKREK